MASFSLQWRKSTKKDLCRIPREAVSMIIAEVEKLADEPLPHGSEKLTGSERARTEFALATIARCMSFSATRKLWRSNACVIGKTFTGSAGRCEAVRELLLKYKIDIKWSDWVSDMAGKAAREAVQRCGKQPRYNGAAGTRATHLRLGYVVACIDGQTERSQCAGAHESKLSEFNSHWTIRLR